MAVYEELSGLKEPKAMDLYGLLGLTPGALSAQEIRSAYRRSALQAHPDKGGSEVLDGFNC